MLLMLGDYKFESKTNINSFQSSLNANIKSSERLNNTPVFFATIKPSESVDIAAKTFPANGSKLDALKPLKDMLKAQKSYSLVTGYGEYLGEFIIMELSETRAVFLSTGEFLEQSFTMKLEKTSIKKGKK